MTNLDTTPVLYTNGQAVEEDAMKSLRLAADLSSPYDVSAFTTAYRRVC